MNPATRPISAKASVTAIPRNIVTPQLTGHLRLAAHALNGFTDDNADTDTGAECCEPVTGRASPLVVVVFWAASWSKFRAAR